MKNAFRHHYAVPHTHATQRWRTKRNKQIKSTWSLFCAHSDHHRHLQITIELRYELGVRGRVLRTVCAAIPYIRTNTSKGINAHTRTNQLTPKWVTKKEEKERKKNLFQQSDTLLLCWVALNVCSATTKPLSYYFITITWDLTIKRILVPFGVVCLHFSCPSHAALTAAIRTDCWQCIYFLRSVWFAVSREYLYRPRANCGVRRITLSNRHTHTHTYELSISAVSTNTTDLSIRPHISTLHHWTFFLFFTSFIITQLQLRSSPPSSSTSASLHPSNMHTTKTKRSVQGK